MIHEKMEQKFNLKTVGVVLVWIGVAVGIVYFAPSVGKMLSSSKIDKKDIPAETAKATLVAGHYEYDMGTISMANGKVRHSYILKNEGPEALAISKVWTSCMCTNAQIKLSNGKIYGPFGMSGGHGGSADTSIDVPAGEEFELISEFDPNAHGPDAVGSIQRSVFIKTNAAKEPLGLSFTADVVK